MNIWSVWFGQWCGRNISMMCNIYFVSLFILSMANSIGKYFQIFTLFNCFIDSSNYIICTLIYVSTASVTKPNWPNIQCDILSNKTRQMYNQWLSIICTYSDTGTRIFAQTKKAPEYCVLFVNCYLIETSWIWILLINISSHFVLFNKWWNHQLCMIGLQIW